jgi:aromatic ring-opening dioxygenase LigB subunit
VKLLQKAAILSVIMLAGCGTNPFKGEFTNRVVMTLSGDEAHVNSMYGPLGIASKVDPKDAEVLRELVRLRAMVEAIARAQAQQQRDKSITPL